MVKKRHNIIGTSEMADGRVITEAEFMADGFEIDPKKNKEWFDEGQCIFDPNYAARTRERFRVERAEARKAELQAEADRIRTQIESL